MDKVSVLVAVYNAAQYLEQCLDSLVGQSYPAVEIICADDASTDGSPAILHRYAERYTQLKLITMPRNSGAAAARNAAFALATGSYVCMVDADDYLSTDAIAQAMTCFAAHPVTDMVLFSLLKVYPTHTEPFVLPPFVSLSGLEAFQESLTFRVHGLYVVRAAIQQRCPYDEQGNIYADEYTTRLHFRMAREVRCCQGTYYYRQHPASVSHQVSIRRFDMLQADIALRRLADDTGISSAADERFETYRWLRLIDAFGLYANNRKRWNGAERRYIRQLMRETYTSIDKRKIHLHKPGYIAVSSWSLFCLQEHLYFALRRWLKR